MKPATRSAAVICPATTPTVLKMEEMSPILNSSLLRMRETSTIATFVAVRNTSIIASKVASNAYEWRFILPPYILIFMLSISGNCLVIATLASNRRMRTITNVYLLNLGLFIMSSVRRRGEVGCSTSLPESLLSFCRPIKWDSGRSYIKSRLFRVTAGLFNMSSERNITTTTHTA
uniref:SFRICE_018936 n=1 Tax=Spodoptera frugiperda TaxID=7108 RepID=A0A2H1VHM6_SPOFR